MAREGILVEPLQAAAPHLGIQQIPRPRIHLDLIRLNPARISHKVRGIDCERILPLEILMHANPGEILRPFQKRKHLFLRGALEDLVPGPSWPRIQDFLDLLPGQIPRERGDALQRLSRLGTPQTVRAECGRIDLAVGCKRSPLTVEDVSPRIGKPCPVPEVVACLVEVVGMLDQGKPRHAAAQNEQHQAEQPEKDHAPPGVLSELCEGF